MKRLDDTTLEAIAEVICGQGEGAGGGYTAPEPYSTSSPTATMLRYCSSRSVPRRDSTGKR